MLEMEKLVHMTHGYIVMSKGAPLPISRQKIIGRKDVTTPVSKSTDLEILNLSFPTV